MKKLGKLLTIALYCWAIFATAMLYRAEAIERKVPSRNVHRFFYRYDDEAGFSYLKALFPPIVITTRTPHDNAPLRPLVSGDVLICEEYQRVSKVVDLGGSPTIIHEMVLDCKNAKRRPVGEFVIKGMNFRGD